jgi:hypothetical protein
MSDEQLTRVHRFVVGRRQLGEICFLYPGEPAASACVVVVPSGGGGAGGARAWAVR